MAYDFSNVSVLIVEDNQPMVQITRAILETFGIQKIHSAPNGEAGFKKFNEDTYDLLLVDWMMKPMNGIELTEKIRTDVHSKNTFVPIILMTGFSEKKRVFRARDKGVTEFLVKPFTANDLYKRLVQIIERPRQFVKYPQFTGPDRRRKAIDGDLIPKRRDGDKE
jgi:two-component system chemotaxis response regulator CheY